MNEGWKVTRSLAWFGLLSLVTVCLLVAGGCSSSSTNSSKQQGSKKSSGKQAKGPSSQPASTAASAAGGTTSALTGSSTSTTSALGNATTMRMTGGTTMTGATTVGGTTGPSDQLGRVSGGGGKFPVEIRADGTESPKLWPDACKMLSDKEIKKIVPKVKKISRVGQHAEFLSGGETPKYSSCDYKLPRPSDPYGPDQPSTVTVDLQGVAAPRLIEQRYMQAKAQQKKTAKKYPDQYKDYGKSLGGADCFWDGNEIQCIKGHFSFWILGQQVTDGNGLKADKQWRSEVLTKVIKTLASKMS